jgi:hypothetical protein
MGKKEEYDRISKELRQAAKEEKGRQSNRQPKYDADRDAAESRRRALEKAKNDPVWGENGRAKKR